MKRVKAVIKRKDGGPDDKWEEEFNVTSIETAEDEIRATVNTFNIQEVAQYESRARTREFVKLLHEVGELCDWHKKIQCDERRKVVYECRRCGLIYKIDHASLAHPPKKKCHPERVCRICNYEYKTEGRLATHRRKKHGQES